MSSEHRNRPRISAQAGTVALVAVTIAVICALVVLSNTGSDPQPADRADPDVAATTSTTVAPVEPTTQPSTRDRKKAQRPRIPEIDRKLANKVEKISRRVPDPPTIFRVSSFNVLGASHTSGPRGRKGFGPGAARMVRAAGVLRASRVDVVGLQEFEQSQYGVFRSQMPSFSVFPDSAGGGIDRANAIAWDDTTWDLVRGDGIAIPYFGGRPKLMPYVLLENRASGKQVWFANFHNPANVAGPAAGLRLEALRREARLALSLSADGTPVIMTGDMNDRVPYVCPFTAASGMRSANGAYTDSSGCHTVKAMNVDWIMGTPDVEFSNFWANFATKTGHISDHPMISATVTIPSEDAS